MIREVRMDEYEQLMELYLHLHETSVPPAELTRPLWERLVNDPDYHLIAAEEDGKLVGAAVSGIGTIGKAVAGLVGKVGGLIAAHPEVFAIIALVAGIAGLGLFLWKKYGLSLIHI